MTTLTLDIRDLLEDECGFEFAKDLFINSMPSDLHDGCCLYDNSNSPPDGDLSGNVIRNDGIQVIVRGVNYKEVMKRVQTIIDALHGLANTKINNTTYMYVKLQSGPFVIPFFGLNSAGLSNKNKIQISINFTVKRTV